VGFSAESVVRKFVLIDTIFRGTPIVETLVFSLTSGDGLQGKSFGGFWRLLIDSILINKERILTSGDLRCRFESG
jgi:hypothetical protein